MVQWTGLLVCTNFKRKKEERKDLTPQTEPAELSDLSELIRRLNEIWSSEQNCLREEDKPCPCGLCGLVVSVPAVHIKDPVLNPPAGK